MSPIKKLMLQQCRTTKSCQNKKKSYSTNFTMPTKSHECISHL